MALCHALAALGLWPLTVATVDHGFRVGSAADAAFVVEFAGQQGLPAELLRLPVDPTTRREGEGPEDSARRARHRLLEETRRRVGAELIVLAHTADDQWETMMMRLAAGAGVQGLAGMFVAHDRRVRPWLGVARRAVAEYATAHSVPWRDDPTNEDPRFLRNRVRGHLRVAFDTTFGPSGVGGAARAASLVRAEATALDELAHGLRARWVRDETITDPGEVRVSLDAAAVREASPDLRAVMIHRLLLRMYVDADRAPPRRMSERVARICLALSRGQGRGVGTRDGFALVQGRGVIELTLSSRRLAVVDLPRPPA